MFNILNTLPQNTMRISGYLITVIALYLGLDVSETQAKIVLDNINVIIGSVGAILTILGQIRASKGYK